MSSKPKKAAKKKAASKATPKAAPSASAKSPAKKASPKKKAAADGVELARLRRLAARGWNVDRCVLLGIKLDVGPRSNPWQRPCRFDPTVSELAVAIVESEAPPEALEFAAARLRDRGES